jgi:hypothetical protein
MEYGYGLDAVRFSYSLFSHIWEERMIVGVENQVLYILLTCSSPKGVDGHMGIKID